MGTHRKIYVMGNLIYFSPFFKYHNLHYLGSSGECPNGIDIVIDHDLIIHPFSTEQGSKDTIFYVQGCISTRLILDNRTELQPKDILGVYDGELLNIRNIRNTSFRNPEEQQALFRMIWMYIFSAYDYFLFELLKVKFISDPTVIEKYMADNAKKIKTSDALIKHLQYNIWASREEVLKKNFEYVHITYPEYTPDMKRFIDYRHLIVHKLGYDEDHKKISLDIIKIELLEKEIRSLIDQIFVQI